MKKTAETITTRKRRAKRRYFTAVVTLALFPARPLWTAYSAPMVVKISLAKAIIKPPNRHSRNASQFEQCH